MLNVRIPDDLRDRIDALRGDVPRERFIRRLLEGALVQRECYDESYRYKIGAPSEPSSLTLREES